MIYEIKLLHNIQHILYILYIYPKNMLNKKQMMIVPCNTI